MLRSAAACSSFSWDRVLEFLQLPLCLRPDACGGAEFLSAAGALPIMNRHLNLSGSGFWCYVPFFDEVFSGDRESAVLAFCFGFHALFQRRFYVESWFSLCVLKLSRFCQKGIEKKDS